MNLQPPGGSGSIILPNGRSLQTSLAEQLFCALGPRRASSSRALAATGAPRLVSTISRPPMLLDSLSGKVLGQTVVLKSRGGGSLSAKPLPRSRPHPLRRFSTLPRMPLTYRADGESDPARAGQCEGCHGPSANHAANDYDPVSRPNLNLPLSGTSCGACHPAIYKDWKTSGHAGCPTCHEPHQLTGFPAQVRGPLYSTNDYVSRTLDD